MTEGVSEFHKTEWEMKSVLFVSAHEGVPREMGEEWGWFFHGAKEQLCHSLFTCLASISCPGKSASLAAAQGLDVWEDLWGDEQRKTKSFEGCVSPQLCHIHGFLRALISWIDPEGKGELMACPQQGLWGWNCCGWEEKNPLNPSASVLNHP